MIENNNDEVLILGLPKSDYLRALKINKTESKLEKKALGKMIPKNDPTWLERKLHQKLR